MLTDQLAAILSDRTAIERLKKEDHGRRESESCLYAMSETFGRPCSLTWLIPTSVRFNGLTYEELSTSELATAFYDFPAESSYAQSDLASEDAPLQSIETDVDGAMTRATSPPARRHGALIRVASS